MLQKIAVGMDGRLNQPALALENPEFKVKKFRRHFQFFGHGEEECILTETFRYHIILQEIFSSKKIGFVLHLG